MVSIEEQMRVAAITAGFDCTEFLPKIARARERMGLDIHTCPCAANDAERGCISVKCAKEIMETGRCHCNAFKIREINR